MIEILIWNFWGFEIRINYRLSRKGLEKRIKKILCILASNHSQSVTIEEFSGKGWEISLKQIQLEMRGLASSVFVSEDDLFSALVSMTQDGSNLFEGGPTGLLSFEVLCKPDRLVLYTCTKAL